MTKNILKISPLLLILALQACGGGGSDDNEGSGNDGAGDNGTQNNPVPDLQTNTRNQNILLTGVLVDAGPVAGLSYETNTQTGITNTAGQFDYNEGETVQFSLGNQDLGNSVLAGATINSATITAPSEENPDPFVNTTRLLQTLDTDSDPSNGINISEAAATAIEDNGLTLNINQPIAEFEMDANVLTLISNGGQDTPPSALIDAETAVVTSLTAIGSTFHIGAWEFDVPVALDPEQTSLSTRLILLENSTFIFANIDERDFTNEEPCGSLGVETGTFTVTTDSLVLTLAYDTNGCKGLFDDTDGDVAGTTITFPFAGTSANTFNLEFLDDNDNPVSVELNRTPNSATDLTGLWIEGGTTAALLHFAPNGYLTFYEDPAIAENGLPHIDLLRYNYDAAARELTVERLATSNTNGDAAPIGQITTIPNVTVTSDNLSFTEDGETVTFTRVLPY